MEYPEQPRAYEKRGRAEIERCGRTAGPFGEAPPATGIAYPCQRRVSGFSTRAGRLMIGPAGKPQSNPGTMVVQITAAVRGSASMRIAKMMEPAAKLTLNRPQIKPAVTTARTTSRPGHADAAATVAASVRG